MKKKEKKEKKPAVYQMTAEQIAGIHENAYNEAIKAMRQEAKDRAIEAKTKAGIYYIAIAVDVMTEEFCWNDEECNWLVGELIDRYNKIQDREDILQILARVEERSGYRLEPTGKELGL